MTEKQSATAVKTFKPIICERCNKEVETYSQMACSGDLYVCLDCKEENRSIDNARYDAWATSGYRHSK
jgi:DNA-directed RNA polymerase subunit RPC12/RpoP